MPGKTNIGWATDSWNPVTGCSRVSAGCDACYAEELSLRYGWSQKPWTADNAAENVVLHPERLGIPAKWTKPRQIFVNSMSDLFHPRVPGTFINDVWMQMYNNPRHTFMVLTKRPKRLRDWTHTKAQSTGWPIDEIWPDWMWVGTSIESRDHIDRADMLRETPAAIRFISAEPLLGPVVLGCDTCDTKGWVGRETTEMGQECCGQYLRTGECCGNPVPAPVPSLEQVDCPDCYRGLRGVEDLRGIHWLIAGGESGPQHRPMELDWMAYLQVACRWAGTAFFAKQDAHRLPGQRGRIPDSLWVQEFPQREAQGTLL